MRSSLKSSLCYYQRLENTPHDHIIRHKRLGGLIVPILAVGDTDYNLPRAVNRWQSNDRQRAGGPRYIDK